jgi:hypothetical protein
MNEPESVKPASPTAGPAPAGHGFGTAPVFLASISTILGAKSLRIIGTDDRVDYNRLVEQRSASADLVICGFTGERLQEKGPDFFLRHAALRDVLWVQAQEQVLID